MRPVVFVVLSQLLALCGSVHSACAYRSQREIAGGQGNQKFEWLYDKLWNVTVFACNDHGLHRATLGRPAIRIPTVSTLSTRWPSRWDYIYCSGWKTKRRQKSFLRVLPSGCTIVCHRRPDGTECTTRARYLHPHRVARCLWRRSFLTCEPGLTLSGLKLTRDEATHELRGVRAICSQAPEFFDSSFNECEVTPPQGRPPTTALEFL